MRVRRAGSVRHVARCDLERPADTDRPPRRTLDSGVASQRSTGDSTQRRCRREASVLSVPSLRSRRSAAALQTQRAQGRGGRPSSADSGGPPTHPARPASPVSQAALASCGSIRTPSERGGADREAGVRSEVGACRSVALSVRSFALHEVVARAKVFGTPWRRRIMTRWIIPLQPPQMPSLWCQKVRPCSKSQTFSTASVSGSP